MGIVIVFVLLIFLLYQINHLFDFLPKISIPKQKVSKDRVIELNKEDKADPKPFNVINKMYFEKYIQKHSSNEKSQSTAINMDIVEKIKKEDEQNILFLNDLLSSKDIHEIETQFDEISSMDEVKFEEDELVVINYLSKHDNVAFTEFHQFCEIENIYFPNVIIEKINHKSILIFNNILIQEDNGFLSIEKEILKKI